MSLLSRFAYRFRATKPDVALLVERVPVIPPCAGWLLHNTGRCKCYEEYPRERERQRVAA